MLSKLGMLSRIWIKCRTAIMQTVAICMGDFQKLRHDPSELFMRMTQPVIWLLLFGQSMARIEVPVAGKVPYIDFIAPGILAQSTLFVAIFYGIALIWEKDMGILHRTLVTPTPRTVLVLGRAFSAGVRSLVQAPVIYLLSFILGVNLRFDPISLLGLIFMVMLGGAIFSTFSLIVACIVKKRERFMGIGQVLTMPLFFASNALYPVTVMPEWIRFISRLNPLTYQVDALRTFMISGETSHFGIAIDFYVGIGVFAALVFYAKTIYPKILY